MSKLVYNLKALKKTLLLRPKKKNCFICEFFKTTRIGQRVYIAKTTFSSSLDEKKKHIIHVRLVLRLLFVVLSAQLLLWLIRNFVGVSMFNEIKLLYESV